MCALSRKYPRLYRLEIPLFPLQRDVSHSKFLTDRVKTSVQPVLAGVDLSKFDRRTRRRVALSSLLRRTTRVFFKTSKHEYDIQQVNLG